MFHASRLRHLCAIVLLSLWTQAVIAAPELFSPKIRRVLFLGDSITHSGQYAAAMEVFYVADSADPSVEFFNLGLPSETVSGLSEPGHAGVNFHDLIYTSGWIVFSLSPSPTSFSRVTE